MKFPFLPLFLALLLVSTALATDSIFFARMPLKYQSTLDTWVSNCKSADGVVLSGITHSAFAFINTNDELMKKPECSSATLKAVFTEDGSFVYVQADTYDPQTVYDTANDSTSLCIYQRSAGQVICQDGGDVEVCVSGDCPINKSVLPSAFLALIGAAIVAFIV